MNELDILVLALKILTSTPYTVSINIIKDAEGNEHHEYAMIDTRTSEVLFTHQSESTFAYVFIERIKAHRLFIA